MTTVVLNLQQVGLTDEQFYNLCQVDPQNNRVEIYRHGKNTKIVQLPYSLSRENILPDINFTKRA